ncbi:hypothetical protein AJ80_01428 [Polytolypa hystricis UAMH7299]|uniref:Zn(2)-C6 fungal-type domain-containing protein n=1 Tax=Polytolypa hystricis (strain UAMH7299) TaxID=1447883 RepID=A0A2B7Z1Y6_POLH7|nr:hypothetical protein AJ80_01428 [Polytolypa hystricis UAMH7299]
MLRPRLRTKTGCQQRRRRRKKCDETRPTCQACTRLRLPCTWDGTESDQRPSSDARESQTRRELTVRQRIPTSAAENGSASSSSSGPSSGPSSASTVASRSLVPRTSHHRSTVIAPRLIRSPSQNYPGIRNETDHGLFSQFAVKFLSLMIKPDAPPEIRDQSYTMSVGLRYPCAMDALLGVVAFWKSSQHPSLRQVAFNHYCLGVRGLREQIAASSDPTSHDPFLLSALFLGMLEVWLCDCSNRALIHFTAAAQILQRRPIMDKGPKGTILPFHTLAAECVVWHLGMLPLFNDGDLDTVARVVSWKLLSNYLSENLFTTGSGEEASPIVGAGPFHSLQRLAFEVVRVGRHFPLNDADFIQVCEYEAELDKVVALLSDALASKAHYLEELSGPPRGPPSPEIIDIISKYGDYLWAIALQIYVAKVKSPETNTTSCPNTRARVSEAMELFLSPAVNALASTPAAEHLCLPLTIFACAALEPEDVKVAKDLIALLSQRGSYGHVRRVTFTTERVWRRTLRSPRHIPESGDQERSSSSGYVLDGLDYLIKGDIFEASDNRIVSIEN